MFLKIDLYDFSFKKGLTMKIKVELPIERDSFNTYPNDPLVIEADEDGLVTITIDGERDIVLKLDSLQKALRVISQ